MHLHDLPVGREVSEKKYEIVYRGHSIRSSQTVFKAGDRFTTVTKCGRNYREIKTAQKR